MEVYNKYNMPQEPYRDAPGGLPLMESFYSLQGEGYHQGKAAYFIRLAGCDIGCVWCDVKESWEKERYRKFSVADLVAAARQYPGPIAVVTGGEPAMYDLEDLTAGLHEARLAAHLETSGAYPITGQWDWICVSPKKFKSPLQESLQKASELKVIVYNRSDLSWAEKNAAGVAPHCRLYLQPEWGNASKMIPLIVEYIKEHPAWELSLQLHKYIGVP